MNCLNKYEIQPYIDNEVSSKEIEAFEKHLEQCSTCKSLYILTKEEVFSIQQSLSENELPDSEIAIPEFIHRKPGGRMWMTSISAAASLALIIGLYFAFNNNMLRSRQMNKSELEVEQMLYQCDPNKLWNAKQPVITVTNEQGEIIYSSINN